MNPSWPVAILAVATIGGDVRAQQAAFFPLDTPAHQLTSEVWGMSADGLVVVGVAANRPVRWTLCGREDLPLSPAAPSGSALACDATGSTVVGRSDPGYAARWVGLERQPLALNGCDSYAAGISDDASVIVGNARRCELPFTDERDVFRIDAAGWHWLTDTGRNDWSETHAAGISPDGSAVLGRLQVSNNRSPPCRWSAAGLEMLGVPAGWESIINGAARAASADGSTIVGEVQQPENDIAPVRWQMPAGECFPLASGVLRGQAFGVTADGSTIVGYVAIAGAIGNEFFAFIWDSAAGLRSIQDVYASQGVDFLGWQLRTAKAISRDGSVIAGEGTDPDGHLRAWVIRPTYCPADADRNGIRSVNDLFTFLALYFGGNCRADINHSGGLSVQDVFDFLAAYFAGCR